MQVRDLLSPQDVLTLATPGKREVLRAVADHAATRLGLQGADVLQALLQREALGSTGIGGGVALPHARFAAIARPFGVFAVLARAVEYGAIDDKPVDLLVALLLPAEPAELQVKPLACVARRLRHPGLIDRLRAIADPTARFDLLVDA